MARELTAEELASLNARRLSPEEAAAFDAHQPERVPVNDVAEIPAFETEDDEVVFWATHALGPGLLAGLARVSVQTLCQSAGLGTAASGPGVTVAGASAESAATEDDVRGAGGSGGETRAAPGAGTGRRQKA